MSSKPPTYTETLASIKETLQAIAAQTKPLPDVPELDVLLVRFAEQDRRQEEMLRLQRESNGIVREQGTAIAVHGQWIEDHVTVAHTALQREVESVRKRANVLATIVAAFNTVVTFLTAVFGGKISP